MTAPTHPFSETYWTRFSGIARLYGLEGLKKLNTAHVCIVGIGGVGTWVVEALARTGIGELTLVDMDEVCVSNVNRQLHALDGQIGKMKIDAMKERVLAINPECKVNCEYRFFTAKTADQLLSTQYNYVCDAIDSVSEKCLLIDGCKKRDIPVITCGGAGGRMDPSKIQVTDLSRTENDSLLAFVRKKLRQDYKYPRQRRHKFKVPCVYSPEDAVYPHSDGSVCATKEEGSELRLNCDFGYGTATHITGTFGYHLAAKIIGDITDT